MDKKCKKCGVIIDGLYGSGIYCSRKCANSREFTEKSKELKSISNKKHIIDIGKWGFQTLSKEIRLVAAKKSAKKSSVTWNKKLLDMPFHEVPKGRIRKRIILEQEDKCARCKLDKWQEEKIILELEHIDGNHKNNVKENLIALCPNCHSLTKTWRGRNKLHSPKKSNEEVYSAYIENNKNISQTLLQLGKVPKGKNYKRVMDIVYEFEKPI